MKRFIIGGAVALIVTPAMAQAPTDTIQSLQNVNNVIVTQSGASSTIVVQGTKDNPDFYYSLDTQVADAAGIATDTEWEFSFPFLKDKPRRKKVCLTWGRDLYIGAALPTSGPEGLDGSVEFGFGQMAGIEYLPWVKGPQFSLGVGIHYRQYTLHGKQVFEASNHVLGIVPAEADKVSSRLRNFGFQVPLTIYQPIYKDLGVTVGVAAVFNTFTRAASDCFVGNLRTHKSFTGLHQRLLTYDIFAQIGWKDNLGVYVRYSPASLFESQWGPQFKTISVGVTIGM